MIKKISHVCMYVCMCTVLVVGALAFSACSNSAAPTLPQNNTPSKPENPPAPPTPQPAPDIDIYGEYKGIFNASQVSFVLSKTRADFYSVVMSKHYTNITFTDDKDGNWNIECYDDGKPHIAAELKVAALINTKRNPFTALITIHGMGGQQVNCEKTGGEPGLKIEGTILKGYRGPKPTGILTVPADITAIDQEAFKNCTGLSEIQFPATLQGIYDAAFSGCTGIKELHFPEKLTTIGKEAFSNCTAVKTLDFSQSTKLERIEDEAFRGCTSFETLNLPVNLKRIGESAFNGCDNITGKVQFPALLKEIGDSAFLECKKITEIDFSACTQLTKIEKAAFNRCTELSQAKLPASLTKIENIFTGCTKLSQLSVDPANSVLYAENNIVYNKAKTELIFAAPAVAQANAIPPSVAKIGASAFVNNQALTSVTLPAALSEIAEGAFNTCKKLQTVDFSASPLLKTIGEAAFNNCEELTGILVFPATLTEIGEGAFAGCEKITKADLYACTQLNQIAQGAFDGCQCRFRVKAGSGVKEKLTAAGVNASAIDEE